MSNDYKPISVRYPCTVHFRNSYGEERPIGQAKNYEEVIGTIEPFMYKRNFKYYYVRSWMEEEAQILDVGSHTEFFVLRPNKVGMEDSHAKNT